MSKMRLYGKNGLSIEMKLLSTLCVDIEWTV